jgi:hypothetical protein
MSSQERKTDQGSGETEQQARGKSSEEAAPVDAPGERPTAHESDLFPSTTAPRYFGTGSYGTGGSTTEGNDGIGDLNPLGGYGTFTDAGGPGSPTLYGEELPLAGVAPPETGAPAPQKAAEKPVAKS